MQVMSVIIMSDNVAIHNSLIGLAIPIILVVIVCCIASMAKLIYTDKYLNQNCERKHKRKAAITVLILSIQYVVLNACGATLLTLQYHFERVREKDQSEVKIPRYLLLYIAIAVIHLNSILNPLVYIWRVNKLRKPLKNTMMKILPCKGVISLGALQPSLTITNPRGLTVNEVVTQPIGPV